MVGLEIKIIEGSESKEETEKEFLVSALQSVVRTAMDEVKTYGEAEGGIRKVALKMRDNEFKYGNNNIIYQITEADIEKDEHGRIVSKGELGMRHGLFIKGIQLDNSDDPVSEIVNLELPRDISFVRKNTLSSFNLPKGIKPKDLNSLSYNIHRAYKIGQDTFLKASEQLLKQKR